MSERKWTDSQRAAFTQRGKQILVSAAAGSGKTAVLTERVKRFATDRDNPCDMSQLLVVTFTRAAAAEMKTRIYDALKDELNNSEINSDGIAYIKRQMASVPLADISTIDSFCGKIVKENFSKADVSADYRLLDEKERVELTEHAVKTVIDELYEDDSRDFLKLSSMFLSERDDKALSKIICNLHKNSLSYPSPEKYLDEICESFSPLKTPNETKGIDVIYDHIKLFSDFYIKAFNRAIYLCNAGDTSAPVKELEQLKSCAENREWDNLVTLIRQNFIFIPSKALFKSSDEYLKKKVVNKLIDDFKSDWEKINKLTLPLTAEHQEDCRILQPVVCAICDAVKLLQNKLTELKEERNALDFNDVLHKCIDLLVDFKDGSWEPTELARDLGKMYKEILIDEYQDTNEAQDIIFNALLNENNNLYRVGDVKQSIYKFRSASPELFIDLKKKSLICGDPLVITLEKNFRSRKGVLDATNYMFKSLMSESVGEITYDENEQLYYGSVDYSQKSTPDVELLCFDYSDFNSENARAEEAKQIAVYIERLLKSGITVYTKNGIEPLKPKHICILLRGVKGGVGDAYSKALTNRGIKVNGVFESDSSAKREIQLLTSFIKVVNNPLDNISLLSVLFSPVFGFTVDELAEIRMEKRQADIYPCLTELAPQSEKIRKFLNKLKLYRNISVSFPVNEFIRFLVRDTDISNIFLSSENGETRKKNIKKFISFADSFTENGRVGLSAFVRSLESALDSGKLEAVGGSVDPDGVQITTIHKSKGLEYPYVILANMFKEFNSDDATDKNPLRISRKVGVGLKIRDDENFTKYNTVSSVAASQDILYSSASEELRVLYVAMTRAREHLTFVCSFRSRDGLKARLCLNNIMGFYEGALHPYKVYSASSMGEWVLSCLLKHSDCSLVKQIAGIPVNEADDIPYCMDSSPAVEISDINENNETVFDSTVDSELISLMNERASFEYKYDCTGILAKRTASSLENTGDKSSYFAIKKPGFMNSKLTGADRGTAIHKFFELCDFSRAAVDVQAEKQLLFDRGLLTQDEIDVLDIDSVNSFFNSSVGKRLLKSNDVFKEYEFSYFKNAGDVYEGLGDDVKNEKIIIQGKLDCAFREADYAVLIDYKSDAQTDESVYVRTYSPQLNHYAEALTACTGLPVKEKYIYSFKLKKFIEL